MDKHNFDIIEEYMLLCMKDSAHDRGHVYRVLYNALDIARYENDVCPEILISACLLHDIGREAQSRDPSVCHAAIGSVMTYEFLVSKQFKVQFAEQVKHCIATHRYRNDSPPLTKEAKILFDADKLDVAGAVGIARTFLYQGAQNSHVPEEKANVDAMQAFINEYNYKLINIYDRFYTDRGRVLAEKKKEHAEAFYYSLKKELDEGMDPADLLEEYFN